MAIIQWLIESQQIPVVGRVARQLLGLYAVDVPTTVKIGIDLRLPHKAPGLIINGGTIVGDHVTLFQGVTIGRYDAGERSSSESDFRGVVIEDHVVIYPGAVIVGGPGVTTIGRGAVIGANSVVTRDVAGEVWAGVPARRLSLRRNLPGTAD